MLETLYKSIEGKQPDSKVYLDPITSEYYTQQTVVPQQNYNYMSGGTAQMYSNPMSGGMGGTASMYDNPMNNTPQIIRTNTGDISMVSKMMQNRQPYQYNVPSIAQMFPTMAMPMMNQQYAGGAGKFLGGLLGNSPMLSQANAGNAPMTSSSGAGRFA